MTSAALFKGIATGFFIAAPVGPIGLLCIRRSLADGRSIGFYTGLGAATADAAYGGIAAFGLTAVSGFLAGQRLWLGLIGGLFLCYLGVRTFLTRPAALQTGAGGNNLLAAYFSTLLLTLANPTTIVSFLAVFAAFGLGEETGRLTAGALMLGVFIGSVLWWSLLSGGVAWFRSRVTAGWMRVVNRLSGGLLFAFGIYALTVFLLQ